MGQLIENKNKILFFLIFILVLGIISFPVIFGIIGTVLPSIGNFLDVSDDLTFEH